VQNDLLDLEKRSWFEQKEVDALKDLADHATRVRHGFCRPSTATSISVHTAH
jgi:hypothetical protein